MKTTVILKDKAAYDDFVAFAKEAGLRVYNREYHEFKVYDKDGRIEFPYVVDVYSNKEHPRKTFYAWVDMKRQQ